MLLVYIEIQFKQNICHNNKMHFTRAVECVIDVDKTQVILRDLSTKLNFYVLVCLSIKVAYTSVITVVTRVLS